MGNETLINKDCEYFLIVCFFFLLRTLNHFNSLCAKDATMSLILSQKKKKSFFIINSREYYNVNRNKFSFVYNHQDKFK